MKQFPDSVILRLGLAAASGPLVVFSLYLLFAGHNQPGGGFAGGLVAGVAVSLAWAAGGTDAIRRILPIRATTLLGAGLTIAVLAGFAGWVVGEAFLDSVAWKATLPVFGEVKFVWSLVFDVGVYLVVLGMSAGIISAVGEGSDRGTP